MNIRFHELNKPNFYTTRRPKILCWACGSHESSISLDTQEVF
jgi:hypothetical protein